MKSPLKEMIHAVSVLFVMLVVACFSAVSASAQCGASDGHLASNTATAMLMRSAAKSSKAPAAQANGAAPAGAAIVGFWHVTFISKGTGFIPDGTVVDMGFSQWHSDGTEILNSSRPPATSNFCLGVWKRLVRSATSSITSLLVPTLMAIWLALPTFAKTSLSVRKARRTQVLFPSTSTIHPAICSYTSLAKSKPLASPWIPRSQTSCELRASWTNLPAISWAVLHHPA
jgi:hypothetical protein